MIKYLMLLFIVISYLPLAAQNVGIGTNNPVTKLDVNGSFQVTAEYINNSNPPTPAQTYTMLNGTTLNMIRADTVSRVYDPGGPSGNYIANLNADFVINAADADDIGSYLQLKIENIELGTGDSLIIYEDTYSTSKVLYRVGNGFNATNIIVNFPNNYGSCEFKSNSDGDVGAGFSLLFLRKYIDQNVPDQPATSGLSFIYNTKNAAIRSGYNNNKPIGIYSTAIGEYNEASGRASLAIGTRNIASNFNSIALGWSLRSRGENSIAMGSGCDATGFTSTSIGSDSKATGYNAMALGVQNLASGPGAKVLGSYSTSSGDNSIAIGNHAEALGNSSMALGNNIKIGGEGSFGITDKSTTTILSGLADNRIYMRFDNGYYFYTDKNLTTGVKLLHGGNSWSTISDSTKKENFQSPDSKNFLEKISNMKLGSWNYKGQDKITFRHYGPMAQEFYRNFGNDGIGTIGNDTTIASADIDGVMLIAIQALIKENELLKSNNEAIKNTNERMEARLQKLETMFNNQDSKIVTRRKE